MSPAVDPNAIPRTTAAAKKAFIKTFQPPSAKFSGKPASHASMQEASESTGSGSAIPLGSLVAVLPLIFGGRFLTKLGSFAAVMASIPTLLDSLHQIPFVGHVLETLKPFVSKVNETLLKHPVIKQFFQLPEDTAISNNLIKAGKFWAGQVASVVKKHLGPLINTFGEAAEKAAAKAV
ncbi:MAG: hypothetical protein AAGI66_03935 [Cyanobacteria bacterium P01_H01_bin.74]